MSDKVQLRIFVQAFTLLAEDALDKIEYFVKTHRQVETLSEIFDGLIKGGHLQEGINQDQLRNLLKDYDYVDIGELNNWVDEAYEYLGEDKDEF